MKGRLVEDKGSCRRGKTSTYYYVYQRVDGVHVDVGCAISWVIIAG